MICAEINILKRFFLISCLLVCFSIHLGRAQGSQTVSNGDTTQTVVLGGLGCLYSWTNDKPGIGLPATGTGDIASFKAVNKGTTPITATITATPIPTGFAYIADTDDNAITIISTITNTVVGTIPNGGVSPVGVAVSLDGKRVYTSNVHDNTVSVIDAANRKVITKIPVAVSPNGIAISPDGTRLYVASLGPVADKPGTLSIINTATNKVIQTLSVGIKSQGVAVSPDGQKVYISNNGGSSISIMDATDQFVTANIGVCAYPFGIVANPNGASIYVTNESSNSISVINSYNNKVTTTIIINNSFPYGITTSVDGKKLYVIDQRNSALMVYDTDKDTLLKKIPVGFLPVAVSSTPDGREIFVTNSDSNTVTIIDGATDNVITEIPAGNNPNSFGNFIFGPVSCSPVTFTFTVYPSAVITPPPGAVASLNTIYGTASAPTTFNVSGTNIAAGILVTPPPGFEVSADGITFKNTITVSGSGTIPPTPVYIRLLAKTPVGTYSGNIVLSSGSATANVATTNNIVKPAPLTITADNKAKNYLRPNPVFTATFASFVNGEGLAQLTSQPVFTTAATTSSGAGQYPITASGAASPNYTIFYVDGVLTIYPVIIVPNAFTPNADGINDLWDIKYLQIYTNCVVKVYNRYGQQVYQSTGYSKPWDGTTNGKILPFGTYYYAIDIGDGSKPLSGYVQIIR